MINELKQDDFYNYEQKQQYLKQLKNDLKCNNKSNKTNETALSRVITVFKQSKRYEKMVGCDISQMTKEQLSMILPLVLFANKSHISSVRRSFNSLLSYVQWCESLYPVDVNMWKSIKVFSLKTTDCIQESYYKNPLDLCQTLEYFYFPNSSFQEDNTIRKIYFVGLLLLYNGVPEGYFACLLRDDFDFINNVINVKTGQNILQIAMISEFIEYYKSICESVKYKVSSVAAWERTVLQPEFILSTPNCSIEEVYKRITVSLSMINNNKKLLSLKNKKVVNKSIIKTSGLFYRMYKIEIANVDNFKFENYVKYKPQNINFYDLKYDYELFKKAYYSNPLI